MRDEEIPRSCLIPQLHVSLHHEKRALRMPRSWNHEMVVADRNKQKREKNKCKNSRLVVGLVVHYHLVVKKLGPRFLSRLMLSADAPWLMLFG